jgi:hypothetical protein
MPVMDITGLMLQYHPAMIGTQQFFTLIAIVISDYFLPASTSQFSNGKHCLSLS